MGRLHMPTGNSQGRSSRMASGKRASMREGPLAALFRKTEEEGLEGRPPPAVDQPTVETAAEGAAPDQSQAEGGAPDPSHPEPQQLPPRRPRPEPPPARQG